MKPGNGLGGAWGDFDLGYPEEPVNSPTINAGPSTLQTILGAAASITNSVARAIRPQAFQNPLSVGGYNYSQAGSVNPVTGVVNPGAKDIGSAAGGAVGKLFDSVAKIVQEHPLAVGGAAAAILLYKSGRKR